MQKITVSANGEYKVSVPYGADYSVVYVPSNTGTASIQLKGFGTDLTGGLLIPDEQYKVEHGRGVEFTFEVSNFESTFVMVFSYGGGN